MPTRQSAHSNKVREVLADLAPHTLDELVAIAGPLVPAGVAFRKTERDRRTALLRTPVEKRLRPDGERTKGNRETAIRSGRRTMVYDSVDTLVRSGQVRRFRNHENVVTFQKVPDDTDRLNQIRDILRTDFDDSQRCHLIERVLSL